MTPKEFYTQTTALARKLEEAGAIGTALNVLKAAVQYKDYHAKHEKDNKVSGGRKQGFKNHTREWLQQSDMTLAAQALIYAWMLECEIAPEAEIKAEQATLFEKQKIADQLKAKILAAPDITEKCDLLKQWEAQALGAVPNDLFESIIVLPIAYDMQLLNFEFLGGPRRHATLRPNDLMKRLRQLEKENVHDNDVSQYLLRHVGIGGMFVGEAIMLPIMEKLYAAESQLKAIQSALDEKDVTLLDAKFDVLFQAIKAEKKDAIDKLAGIMFEYKEYDFQAVLNMLVNLLRDKNLSVAIKADVIKMILDEFEVRIGDGPLEPEKLNIRMFMEAMLRISTELEASDLLTAVALERMLFDLFIERSLKANELNAWNPKPETREMADIAIANELALGILQPDLKKASGHQLNDFKEKNYEKLESILIDNVMAKFELLHRYKPLGSIVEEYFEAVQVTLQRAADDAYNEIEFSQYTASTRSALTHRVFALSDTTLDQILEMTHWMQTESTEADIYDTEILDGWVSRIKDDLDKYKNLTEKLARIEVLETNTLKLKPIIELLATEKQTAVERLEAQQEDIRRRESQQAYKEANGSQVLADDLMALETVNPETIAKVFEIHLSYWQSSGAPVITENNMNREYMTAVSQHLIIQMKYALNNDPVDIQAIQKMQSVLFELLSYAKTIVVTSETPISGVESRNQGGGSFAYVLDDLMLASVRPEMTKFIEHLIAHPNLENFKAMLTPALLTQKVFLKGTVPQTLFKYMSDLLTPESVRDDRLVEKWFAVAESVLQKDDIPKMRQTVLGTLWKILMPVRLDTVTSLKPLLNTPDYAPRLFALFLAHDFTPVMLGDFLKGLPQGLNPPAFQQGLEHFFNSAAGDETKQTVANSLLGELQTLSKDPLHDMSIDFFTQYHVALKHILNHATADQINQTVNQLATDALSKMNAARAHRKGSPQRNTETQAARKQYAMLAAVLYATPKAKLPENSDAWNTLVASQGKTRATKDTKWGLRTSISNYVLPRLAGEHAGSTLHRHGAELINTLLTKDADNVLTAVFHATRGGNQDKQTHAVEKLSRDAAKHYPDLFKASKPGFGLKSGLFGKTAVTPLPKDPSIANNLDVVYSQTYSSR